MCFMGGGDARGERWDESGAEGACFGPGLEVGRGRNLAERRSPVPRRIAPTGLSRAGRGAMAASSVCWSAGVVTAGGGGASGLAR